ncbi:hypothetical protein HX049_12855 [Myroides odoratimimus]|uniref:hypothetical protein n=1 Tax=Myroides odoratimimus TaxID=76832 RepID=UPI0025778F73|nr:hypothetical protein [Myroides odoratimimus]MDM1398060.1 hypothetical protein [Myroides odoratimimus]
MKKNIFLSLVFTLLFCATSFAQYVYTVKLTDFNFESYDRTRTGSSNSKVSFEVTFEDGSRETLYFEKVRGITYKAVNLQEQLVSVKKPISLKAYVFLHFRNGSYNLNKDFSLSSSGAESEVIPSWLPNKTSDFAFTYEVIKN